MATGFPIIFGKSRSWTPAQIQKSVWLDAADASTITLSGSNVTSWGDKSGNGINAVQSTLANAPVLSAASLNGLPTIRFNGSAGTQIRLDTPAFDFGTSQRTAFFVIKNTGPDVGASSNPIWFWPRAGNGTNSLSITSWITTAVQGTAFMITTTQSKTNYLMASYLFGRTSAIEQLFINGDSAGTATKTAGGSSYSNATSGYAFGGTPGDPSAQYFFDGNIAEVLMFNNALSVPDQQKVEGYLAWKWGMQNTLSATHPYKNYPPFA